MKYFQCYKREPGVEKSSLEPSTATYKQGSSSSQRVRQSSTTQPGPPCLPWGGVPLQRNNGAFYTEGERAGCLFEDVYVF